MKDDSQAREDRIEALERENALFREILNNVHEGIMVTNREGIVTFYNNVMGMIEEIAPEEMIGKPLLALYPLSQKYSSTLTVLDSQEPIYEMQHCYLSTNGKLINIIYSTLPFKYNDKMEAAYCILRDVTKMGSFLSRSVEMYRKLSKTLEAEAHKNGTSFTFEDFITENPRMLSLLQLARNAASHNSNVLICGETGTGKELIAQGIHNASLQADGPFVAVNCAALPDNLVESLLFGSVKGAFTGGQNTPGLFEQAEGGTIFLDEINSMDIDLQGKLLRVLQDKTIRRIGGKENIRINCRILSATNTDPQSKEQSKVLRSDLFYRLSSIYIELPPLRDRSDDLPLLSEFFVKKYNNIYGKNLESIDESLAQAMAAYSWPGNVRELEHFIESSCINVDYGTKVINFENISELFKKKLGNPGPAQVRSRSGQTLKDALLDLEREMVLAALKANDNNVTKAAQELGIYRQALHYRINKLGLADLSGEETE